MFLFLIIRTSYLQLSKEFFRFSLGFCLQYVTRSRAALLKLPFGSFSRFYRQICQGKSTIGKDLILTTFREYRSGLAHWTTGAALVRMGTTRQERTVALYKLLQFVLELLLPRDASLPCAGVARVLWMHPVVSARPPSCIPVSARSYASLCSFLYLKSSGCIDTLSPCCYPCPIYAICVFPTVHFCASFPTVPF